MIPHRKICTDDLANTVRNRVAVCRKRLRYVRATHSFEIYRQLDDQSGERFVSAALPVSRCRLAFSARRLNTQVTSPEEVEEVTEVT